MGADDELRFAGADALEDGGFFGSFQTADEEFDVIASFGENAARGKKMLHGENLGGGHEGGLRAVFDGDDGGFERDDGFSAADVTLEETIHRGRFFEVGDDFLHDFYLGRRRLKRKDSPDCLANGVFVDSESDGVFLAGGFSVEGEAELVEEKFFEDEALLRGRAESVQGVEGFGGLGKVRVDQSFATRGIAQAGAHGFRQNVGHAMVNEPHGGVHGAANLAGAERADGFVNGDDTADFGGVEFLAAEDLYLRIDHFEARGAELVNFGFAVKDEELAGL